MYVVVVLKSPVSWDAREGYCNRFTVPKSLVMMLEKDTVSGLPSLSLLR